LNGMWLPVLDMPPQPIIARVSWFDGAVAPQRTRAGTMLNAPIAAAPLRNSLRVLFMVRNIPKRRAHNQARTVRRLTISRPRSLSSSFMPLRCGKEGAENHKPGKWYNMGMKGSAE